MEKTTNIIIQETKDKLMNVINESKLPASIVSLIVTEFANNINAQARAAMDFEMKQYNDSLKKEKDKK